MKEMKKQLISKNVASEVAEELCQSVSKSLVGQKLDGGFGFSRISTIVKNSLEETIARILNPVFNWP